MKTPRHYFKFMAWLVPAVRAHRKRCTIRKSRKRLPKVGETAVLECWEGAPYRSGVERLGAFRLVNVLPIQIEAWDGRAEGVKIILDGVELIGEEARKLATDDGFDSLQDFADFFRERFPFSGHFFEWDPNQPETEA